MLYVPHVGCVIGCITEFYWAILPTTCVDFLTLKFNTRFVNLHKFETSFSLFDRFLFKFSRNIVKSFEDQIFLFKLTLYCNLFQISRPKDPKYHTSLHFFNIHFSKPDDQKLNKIHFPCSLCTWTCYRWAHKVVRKLSK